MAAQQFLLVGGLLVCIFFSSCQRGFLGKKRDKVRWSAPAFSALGVKGRLVYEDATRKFSSALSVRLRQDSLIWFSAAPALGIEVLRGVMDAHTLSFINRVQKTYYVYAYKELEEMLGHDISYAFVENLLLGQPPFNTAHFEKAQDDGAQEVWTGQYRDIACELMVSKQHNTLSSLQMTSPAGDKLRVDYHYDSLIAVENGLMPTQWTLRLCFWTVEKEECHMTLQFSQRKVTAVPLNKLTFPFKIPNGYVSGR